MSKCPSGRYIIFQAINPKHNLNTMGKTLDLLFYGEDNRLVERFHYTKEREGDFRSDGAVFVPTLPEGTYTTLALFNHDPACYGIFDEERYDEIYSKVSADTVKTPPADLFVGTKPISFNKGEEHITLITMRMAKHTNNVNLKIVFQDYTPPTGATLSSYIYGDNGMFDYSDYACIKNNYRTYLSYNGKTSGSGFETNYKIKTMSLWLDSDIQLVVEEEIPWTRGATTKRSIKINLVEELKKVKNDKGELLYDTDEKLEYNDEYDITMTIGPNFIMLGLTIDDWAIIGGGVEV